MASSSPKAIVIGATSGIGKALAEVLAEHGYRVGITGRRMELLEAMQAQKPQSFNYANTPPTTTYDKGRFKIQQVVNKSYEVESTFYDAFWGSWIAELLSSPEVYMETPSGLVAVIIEDSQIKIEETNELVNVTLTIIEANEISTQQN